MQANVSIVGTSACGRGGRVELLGRYSLSQALERLLADAPCQYRIVDARTVRITAAAAAEAPPPARLPADQPMLVSELVVTAAKRPASLDLLPAGVSAISREQIAVTGAADVGQTVGQVAGVLTTNLGPGRDKLLIRGLSDGAFTGRARSTVSTYLDEAPINYNAPDPDLRLVDVERIEVVRGPQGALYGSGAVSGIYRIITRQPDLDSLEGGLAGTLALTKDGEPSREVEGYLSVPLAAGHAALRIAAYHDYRGGYLDDTRTGEKDVDQTVRNGGRLALRLRVSDDWEMNLRAATQHLRTKDAQYIFPAMGVRRVSPFREGHDNDFSHAALSLAGRVGEIELSSSTAYVHHTFTSQYDASEAGVFNRPGETGAYLENTRVNMLVEDLLIRSGSGGRFNWLAGAFGSLTLERSPSEANFVSAAGRTVTTYEEFRKDRLEEAALYGEADYAFADGWKATLGGRLFRSRVRTSAEIEVAPGIPLARSRVVGYARSFDGFSPKLALQRAFANGSLAYALVSEGYRPGGFNTAGVTYLRQERTFFQPDRLRNYEIGAKLRLFEGRMALRSAVYYDEWNDIQTDQYRPTGLSYTTNVGDARIVGLETEVGYDWDFGLSVQVNALLTDSRLANPNPNFTGPVAEELPGIPAASGGVVAVYQRPLPGTFVMRFVGEASYVGRSSISFDAAATRRMGDYVRAKISAEVASDIWTAAVFVSNPLDDDSDTFAYGNPFSFRAVRQVTPQRPRTVGVRLAANF
ncbi:TonB-dependent receptor [Phenylobacterium sp. J426]|uniref:TonB-dependent receptor n=1 Tax=Phenylobacterium sp. J426 TaxID=2898439 RepID=UPI0027E2C71E|nr:TonB-dependent receptor [Phenylobacterium sp. J426]